MLKTLNMNIQWFQLMSKNSHLYLDLIPPSTADIEKGFSVLTMLHTKYLNILTPSSLDKLIQLVLLGTPTLSDETWEGLVDQYNQRHEQCIRLKQWILKTAYAVFSICRLEQWILKTLCGVSPHGKAILFSYFFTDLF